MKVGFIGLGNLGTPIAANLLEETRELYVFNRTVSKTEVLTSAGATACSSVKELAAMCDIVFTVVADDAALNAITLNEGGIVKNLKEGGIHVSISTILPETSERLAAEHASKNQYYVASPVMGRPEAARARKLNFLVSGNDQAVERVKPYLTYCGAAGIWEFGENVRAANVAKLCNNYLIVAAIESMSEAMQLAEKSDIDKHQWFNMITQTLFSAPIYINYGKLLLEEKYLPAGFFLRLGLKDVNLVLQQANSVNAKMPVAQIAKQQFETAIAKGLGEHDWTAVKLALEHD